MKDQKVPVQCLIDHIKTALDVDPWAKEMAEKLIQGKDEGIPAELEGGGTFWWFVCGECHTAIVERFKYCPECGRRIIWDECHQRATSGL